MKNFTIFTLALTFANAAVAAPASTTNAAKGGPIRIDLDFP
jgi:hypothetical protein